MKEGERLWWKWDSKVMLNNIVISDYYMSPNSKDWIGSHFCSGDCKKLDEENLKLCASIGTDVFVPPDIGVYHFELNNASSGTDKTFSVVVSQGIKNYTVTVTNNGFEPSLLTTSPNDRVWWIWQTASGGLSVNIEQVRSDTVPEVSSGEQHSHYGHCSGSNLGTSDGFFCSGNSIDAPSAFMYSFSNTGIYYYTCKRLSNLKNLGIIIVKVQPTIHEVQVQPKFITPDPVIININDIVVWSFKNHCNFNLVNIESMGQMLDAFQQSRVQDPRRCLEKGYNAVGMYHVASKSFLLEEPDSKSQLVQDQVISTVIVDNITEYSVVRVTDSGFYPPEMTILKSESVLWSWKGSEIDHNIVHISPDDSKANSNNAGTVTKKTLDSGKPVPNSSFFHTFDNPGLYYVASVGAPGLTCAIIVMKHAVKTPRPSIIHNNSPNESTIPGTQDFQHNTANLTVHRGHRVMINCESDNRSLRDVKIYFTTNGTCPLPHNEHVKIYSARHGIKLDTSGIFYVRALAVARDMLYSDVAISKRFWVLQDLDKSESTTESQNTVKSTPNLLKQDHAGEKEDWLWYNCLPVIAIYNNNFEEGRLVLEIKLENDATTELEDALRLVDCYRLFINGVDYYGPIESDSNLIMLEGFLSTKIYDICLTVNSVENKYKRHVSNHLNFRVPAINENGGPYLSCLTQKEDNKITLIWRNVSGAMGCVLSKYKLLLLDRNQSSRRSEEATNAIDVPLEDSSPWCSLVLEDCNLGQEYLFQIKGVSEDGDEIGDKAAPILSNKLSITLPIDQSKIQFDLDLIEFDLDNKHLDVEITNSGNEYIFLTEISDETSSEYSSNDSDASESGDSHDESEEEMSTGQNSSESGESSSSDLEARIQRKAKNTPGTAEANDDTTVHDISGELSHQTEILVGDGNSKLDVDDNHTTVEDDEGDTLDEMTNDDKPSKEISKEDFQIPSKKQFSKSRKTLWKLRGISRFVKNRNKISTSTMQYNDSENLETTARPLVMANSNLIMDMISAPIPISKNKKQQKTTQDSRPISDPSNSEVSHPQQQQNQIDTDKNEIKFSDKAKNQKVNKQRSKDTVNGPKTAQETNQVDKSRQKVFSYLQTIKDQLGAKNKALKEMELQNPGNIYSYNEETGDYQQQQELEDPVEVDIDATGSPWVNKFKVISATQAAVRGLQKQQQKEQEKQKQSTIIPTGIRKVEEELGEDSEIEIAVRDESNNSTSAGFTVDDKLSTKTHKNNSQALQMTTVSATNFKNLKVNQLYTLNEGKQVNNEDARADPSNSGKFQSLPKPVLQVKQESMNGVNLKWSLDSDVPGHLKIQVYNVKVTGELFQNFVNSDLSYFEENIISHVWNISNGLQCFVTGLMPRVQYCFSVTASYMLSFKPSSSSFARQQNKITTELSSRSSDIIYRLVGPPRPPFLMVKSVDIYQVTVEWHNHRPVRSNSGDNDDDVSEVCEGDDEDDEIQKYFVGFKNNNESDNTIELPGSEKNLVIENIVDGQYLEVFVRSENKYGKSQPSNLLQVTSCPKPNPPLLISEPTFVPRQCIISWTHNNATDIPNGVEIIFYRIYLDNEWYNDVLPSKETGSKDEITYKFVFDNLDYDTAYHVQLLAIARTIKDSDDSKVFSYSQSNLSCELLMTPFKPLENATMRIEEMTSKGILVVWDPPLEDDNENCHVIGYQLLKDGVVYGMEVLPSNVNSLWVKNLSLGDKVVLELKTLTTPPGVDSMANSKLTVHYTGLVSSPSNFEVESINGFSALLVWKKSSKKKNHFNMPEYYQVTWWNSETDTEQDIRSISTKECNVLLSELIPGTNYSVVLQGRRVNKYKELCENSNDTSQPNQIKHNLTLNSEPIKINFQTSSPPSPIRNFQVISTTNQAIALEWQMPHTNGNMKNASFRSNNNIIALVVFYSPATQKNLHQSKFLELTPDTNEIVISDLCENTEYLFQLAIVTEEYITSTISGNMRNNFGSYRTIDGAEEMDQFEDEEQSNHLIKFNERGEIVGDTDWIVISSLSAFTSGVNSPSSIKIINYTSESIELEWKAPSVNGSNHLLAQNVRVSQVSMSNLYGSNKQDFSQMHSREQCYSTELSKYQTTHTIKSLHPATLYTIVVEAIVSVKTAINLARIRQLTPDNTLRLQNNDYDNENRRIVHYSSKQPIYTRTKVQHAPPRFLCCHKILEGGVVYLRWQTPGMRTVVTGDADGGGDHFNCTFIRHVLLGYRIFINGKLHATLKPTLSSCKLTKCKVGKNTIQLSSLIIPEYAPKINLFDNSHRASGNLEDIDLSELGIDECCTDPLVVNLNSPKHLSVASLSCQVISDVAEKCDVELKWSLNVPSTANNRNSKFNTISQETTPNPVKQLNISAIYGENVIRQVLDGQSSMTKFLKLPRGIQCLFQVDICPLSNGSSVTKDREPVMNVANSQTNTSTNLAMSNGSQKVLLFIPDAQGGAPTLAIKSLSDQSVTLDWVNGDFYGVASLKYYRIILNDNSIAGEITDQPESDRRPLLVPLYTHNHYKIYLSATLQLFYQTNSTTTSQSSSHPSPSTKTINSNCLYVSAGPRRRIISEYEYNRLNSMRNYDSPVPNTTALSSPSSAALSLVLQTNTDTTATFSWSLSQDVAPSLVSYMLYWTNKNQSLEEFRIRIESVSIYTYTVENLLPGQRYEFRIEGLDKTEHVVCKSNQIGMQMNSIIEAPKLVLKASNFSYITICWSASSMKGLVKVGKYSVYINGMHHTTLNPDILSYTFQDGQACHQYTFQLQALCDEEKYNSGLSNSITCTWPGCISPSINKLIPLATNSIRVTWNSPTTTEGVKIKHFRLLCFDLQSGELIQAVNYIHPESREAEIFNISKGSYTVRLETYVYGAQFSYVSEPLIVEPESGPDPPVIRAAIKNLAERQAKLQGTIKLLKQKDAVLRCMHYWGQQSYLGSEEQGYFLNCSRILPLIENKIDQVILDLSHNEGYIIVELKWQYSPSNQTVGETGAANPGTSVKPGDAEVVSEIAGFKVLVDGKYYGREIDVTSRSALIKLTQAKSSSQNPEHKLAMIAVSKKPRLLSELSNIIHVNTSCFKPISFFCSPLNHQKNGISESRQCEFRLSLQRERRNLTVKYNPEFCIKPTPCPKLYLHACSNDNNKASQMTQDKPVLLPTSDSSNATNLSIGFLVFWLPFCDTCVDFFNNFNHYTKTNNKNHNIIFNTIGYITGADDGSLDKLLEMINCTDGCDDIQHYWCTENDSSGKENAAFNDAIKILEIITFPTILIIKNGDIIFKGRYYETEVEQLYKSFDSTIQKALLSYKYDPMDDWLCYLDEEQQRYGQNHKLNSFKKITSAAISSSRVGSSSRKSTKTNSARLRGLVDSKIQTNRVLNEFRQMKKDEEHK